MADSGKDFPAGLSEEETRCPRCGAKVAKGAKRCKYGHALTESKEQAVPDPLDRRVEEAIAAIKPPHIGGVGKFRTELHPHDRSGKFAHTFHAPKPPKVGHHVMDVSSGLPQRAEVVRAHPNGSVDVKAGDGHKHLEPHQFHRTAGSDGKTPEPPKAAAPPKGETPEQMRARQRDEAWPPTQGVHPDLAAMRYSGPKELTYGGATGHYTVRVNGETYGGVVGRYGGDVPSGAEPYYAERAGRREGGRSIAGAVKKLTATMAAQTERDKGHPKSIPAALKTPRKLAAYHGPADGTPEKELIVLKYRRENALLGHDHALVAKLDLEIDAHKKKHNLKESAVEPMDRRVERLVEADFRSNLHPRDRNGQWMSKGGMHMLKLPHGGIAGHVTTAGGKFHAYSNYRSTAYTDGHGGVSSGSAKGAEPALLSEHGSMGEARAAVEKYTSDHPSLFPSEPLGGYSNGFYDSSAPSSYDKARASDLLRTSKPGTNGARFAAKNYEAVRQLSDDHLAQLRDGLASDRDRLMALPPASNDQSNGIRDSLIVAMHKDSMRLDAELAQRREAALSKRAKKPYHMGHGMSGLGPTGAPMDAADRISVDSPDSSVNDAPSSGWRISDPSGEYKGEVSSNEGGGGSGRYGASIYNSQRKYEFADGPTPIEAARNAVRKHEAKKR